MSTLTHQFTGDLPPEWASIPPEILTLLVPTMTRTIVLPGGEHRVIENSGMITPQQRALVDRVLASRWFLIKNGGVVTKARCLRCKRYHRYITLGCVEKPFNGMTEIVGFIHRSTTVGVSRTKIGHRQYRETPLMEQSMDAVELGAIEPITVVRARDLILRIRGRVGWEGVVPEVRDPLLALV